MAGETDKLPREEPLVQVAWIAHVFSVVVVATRATGLLPLYGMF